jgi:hypothetical protein
MRRPIAFPIGYFDCTVHGFFDDGGGATEGLPSNGVAAASLQIIFHSIEERNCRTNLN